MVAACRFERPSGLIWVKSSHVDPGIRARRGYTPDMSRGLSPNPMARIAWLIAACIAIGLAVVGVVLPGVPTVPFVLLASWCAMRGSPRLHRWLVTHPRFGAMIVEWERNGAVSRRAKRTAVFMMLLASGLMWLSPAPMWTWLLASATMLVVGAWLWRRPEPGAASAGGRCPDR